MSAYLLDTETTGEEPVPEVIELAILKLNVAGPQLYDPVFYGRFKPTNRILFSAIAVHHILPAELEGEPPSALAKGPAAGGYGVHGRAQRGL